MEEDVRKMLSHLGVKEFLLKQIDEHTHLVFTVRGHDWCRGEQPSSKEPQEIFVVAKIIGLGSSYEKCPYFFNPRSREEYNLLLSYPVNKIEDGEAEIRKARRDRISFQQKRPEKKQAEVKPNTQEPPVVVPDKKSVYGLLDQNNKSSSAGNAGAGSFFDVAPLPRWKCLPLQPGIGELERREGVPDEVYEEGLLEHPAIPGLMLTKEERLYKTMLEIVNEDTGETRFEAVREKPFRVRWQKTIPVFQTRTGKNFFR
jgi:hypothetical protein